MSLQTSTGAPTRKQRQRMDAIKETGCILCRRNLSGWVLPEIHHLLSGGRRIGHDATVGLCAYHHRGVIPEGQRRATMEKQHGPALWYGSKPFKAYWGSDADLLTEQNMILAQSTFYRGAA